MGENFAILTITLPTYHEGGNATFSHSDIRKVVETSSNSAFSISWSVCYSDVSCKVEPPITSDNKLVLTYDLFHVNTSTFKDSAAWSFRGVTTLERLLKFWKQNADVDGPFCNSNFAWVLEHKYDAGNMSVKDLRGDDLS